MDLIKQLYGDIPKKPLPARPKNWFATGQSRAFHSPERLSLYDSRSSLTHARLRQRRLRRSAGPERRTGKQRADIYGLVPMERLSMPDLKWARLTVRPVPRSLTQSRRTTADASAMEQTLRSIIDGYARNGVPARSGGGGQAQRGGVPLS